MSRRPRTALRDTATSIVGSVVPAVLGLASALLVGGAASRDAAAALLLIWSIVGYLSLTDLGLTRSASKLVSGGRSTANAAVAALWRISIGLGIVAASGVAVLVWTLGPHLTTDRIPAIWLICVVPLVSAYQFVLTGVLEGQGAFRSLALQRAGNAVFTYLVPALLLLLVPGSLTITLVMLVGYRLVALLYLWRRAQLSLHGVLRSRRDLKLQDGAETSSVTFWLGLSSVLGALLLYLDRGILASSKPGSETWVFYVTVSEMMMKTYLVPTAVLSVAFPWLITNLVRRREFLHRVLVRWAPAATLVVALSVSVLMTVLAPSILRLMGFPEDSGWMGAVLATAAGATVVNWSSQGYVAFLQAVDRQRLVAFSQLVMIGPYAAAAYVALGVGGPLGLAVAWATRVVAFWILLVLYGRIAFGRGALAKQ